MNNTTILRTLDSGKYNSAVRYKSEINVPKKELADLVNNKTKREINSMFKGWNTSIDLNYGIISLMSKPNLVVDSGVQSALRRNFGVTGFGGAVVRMGVDNGATNPVAGTTQSGANTKTLLAFDSTPTIVGNVITTIRTFTNLNVNFVMKRLLLSYHTADLTNTTTADTAGTLYGMTNVFTIDLTAFSSWSQTFTATVTGSGS